MRLYLLLTAILSLTGPLNVNTQSVDCDHETGAGCSSAGIFSFSDASSGSSADVAPTGHCSRRFRLAVTLRPGRKGFTCCFDIERPSRFIYSFSHSPTATARTSTTPYLFGFGPNAYLQARSVSNNNSYYYNNIWYYYGIHSANRSRTCWTFRNNFVAASHRLGGKRMGHPYLFRPTTSRTYIGLNRRYATTTLAGSGLCKTTCSLL